MKSSIQDYLKKINSSITIFSCLSLLVTVLFLAVFTAFLFIGENKKERSLVYYEKPAENSTETVVDTRPFGSKNGTTYTFSWCSRSNFIKEKNRIYYNNEEAAKNNGKRISLFCKKK